MAELTQIQMLEDKVTARGLNDKGLFDMKTKMVNG